MITVTLAVDATQIPLLSNWQPCCLFSAALLLLFSKWLIEYNLSYPTGHSLSGKCIMYLPDTILFWVAPVSIQPGYFHGYKNLMLWPKQKKQPLQKKITPNQSGKNDPKQSKMPLKCCRSSLGSACFCKMIQQTAVEAWAVFVTYPFIYK